MIKINVPQTPWSEQFFSVSGIEYRFVFKFNERDQRWRMSIFLYDEPIVEGIKIMENQSLLSPYLLDDFAHGDIWCFRLRKDNRPVGFDNLGFGKPYELIYLTNDEILDIVGED